MALGAYEGEQLLADAAEEVFALAERLRVDGITNPSWRVVSVDCAGIEMVQIPGGSFWMGQAEDEGGQGECPRHEVRIEPFQLAATPVTNEQYGRFLAATGYRKPEYWSDSKWNARAQPVVGVSWKDAKNLCEWAGLRLPSEAEWEYACRAGTTTRYWSGDEEGDLARVGWYEQNAGDCTRPVARKPANSWGMSDMHGNVWEWCEDE